MSYTNPKLFVADTGDPKRGKGVFASARISAGELIEDATGDVQVLSKEQVRKLSLVEQGWFYEVDDEHEMGPRDLDNPGLTWFTNHSCNPNVVSLPDFYRTMALRDIELGEELTYDYATTDAGKWDFECACGESNCRGIVRGTDWMLPELQQRYRGFFQQNIQQKIDTLALPGIR